MTAPRICGAYADHVDHVDPRLGRRDSLLQPTGSTRAWRRLRLWILTRDAWRCQVWVDDAGNVIESPRPETPPAGPDDPAWLRAACPRHNLSRGDSLTDARPDSRAEARTTRWDW